MKPRALFTAAVAALTLAAALHAVAQGPAAADSNPDLIEARKYVLTMDKVQKLAAAMDAINKLTASDPALKSKMDADNGSKPIDQRAKDIDTNFPQVAAIIHSHGLTTREFMVVTIAYINDITFVGMKKQGMIKDYPPNSITPENAAFVEANFDKLQQIGQKLSPNQN
jgi:hypothetical protein